MFPTLQDLAACCLFQHKRESENVIRTILDIKRGDYFSCHQCEQIRPLTLRFRCQVPGQNSNDMCSICSDLFSRHPDEIFYTRKDPQTVFCVRCIYPSQVEARVKKDIYLIDVNTNASLEQATRAYWNQHCDIVEAILELSVY